MISPWELMLASYTIHCIICFEHCAMIHVPLQISSKETEVLEEQKKVLETQLKMVQTGGILQRVSMTYMRSCSRLHMRGIMGAYIQLSLTKDVQNDARECGPLGPSRVGSYVRKYLDTLVATYVMPT